MAGLDVGTTPGVSAVELNNPIISSTELDSEDLDSSGMREKREKLRAELQARSGEWPLRSAQDVQQAGLNSTREILDDMAEVHRLAYGLWGAQRRIGSVR